MIPLFDLHCDTLLKIYNNNKNINKNDFHISLDKVSKFSPYIQVCAVWSDAALSNEEAYQNYKNTIEYSKKQMRFSTNCSLNKMCFILSVEDARILNGDLSRVNTLYNDGVRILTLNWRGKSIIGGGWDTNLHLTGLGKETIKQCFEYGIIPDISHSSVNTVDDAFALAEDYKKPIIASHSNAFSVCNHKRNITNEHFKWLVENKSILGISLATEHLCNRDKAEVDDIIRHIDYFLNLGGENTVCLGCDFDGVSSLPSKINSISDLTLLYEEIIKSFDESIAKKVFFKNAYSFMTKNLK